MCRVSREGGAALREDEGDSRRHDYRIVILYRHKDSAASTTLIYEKLVEHFGKEAICLDAESVPLGNDFCDFMSDVISHCVVVLAVIGTDWISITDESGKRRIDNREDPLRFELETAFQQGIPIIPVLVRDASMPPARGLPRSLRRLVRLNGAKVRPTTTDSERDLDRLISALDALLP